MFQSTHPHGVRRCQLLRNNGIVGFQSTHPHGVRLYRIWFIPIRLCVSIHAPTRGATLTKPLFCKTVSFQSTHPHGVRLNGRSAYVWTPSEFQSTHPHGVRPKSCIGTSMAPRCFNPRTHTGCDLKDCGILLSHASFNPRTHTGCDVC